MDILKGFDNLELPIVSKISFKKVFDFWELWAQDVSHPRHLEAQEVLNTVGKIEVLRHSFEDLRIIKKYEHEIETILSCLFPDALQGNEIKTASLPFEPVFFNQTARFRDIIDRAGTDFRLLLRGVTPDLFYFWAAQFYLVVTHGVQLDISRPQIFDIPDLESGIMRSYRAFFNADFGYFESKKSAPKLTPDQIATLIGNGSDLDLWKKLIPPNSAELHGFGITTLFDITTDEAVSNLKTQLINSRALADPVRLQSIEDSLQAYLGVNDLQIGFAVLRDSTLYSNRQYDWRSVMMGDHPSIYCNELLCGEAHSILLDQQMPFLTSDVGQFQKEEIGITTAMRDGGARSYLVQPLTYEDRVVGFLELRSKSPLEINSAVARKLQELVPLFTVALKRATEQAEARIEAIIKEKCTAVHPTVEWKFNQRATELMLRTENYHEMEMDEIVFKGVHPLFGQLDINGSSTYRDKSIKDDLIQQLKLARTVLGDAHEQVAMVMYDQLIYEIDQNIERLSDRLDAGEEMLITSFFQEEIEPLFTHLRSANFDAVSLQRYDQAINDRIGLIYDKRRLYENTVMTINEQIGSYIESAQKSAQKIYPHYFEKYKTDGVEYNMYIGQSMVENQSYHRLYLQNLRLWQLIITCGAENLIHQIKDQLPVPLTVASLIMVQDAPLDIRFRYDEKRFDVDGAYNARYEIIKKRIDKSHIKGTNERLTQPGKIAIVFSSAAERREYDRYLNYLIDRNYLVGSPQYVDLEDLPGASGLHAVRVDINYEDDELGKRLSGEIDSVLGEVLSS